MQPREPSVATAEPPSGSTVRCTGEAGRDGAEEIRRALARATSTGLTHVDVNLRDGGGLDSAAVRYLLAAQRELQRRNGNLRVLAGPHSAPALRRHGLHHLLELVEVECCAQDADGTTAGSPAGSRRETRRHSR